MLILSPTHKWLPNSTLFFADHFFNCLLYFGVQSHRKKDWWRLLFSFKTNSFEDVGRFASSRARGGNSIVQNQMVELQFVLVPKGSQPLTEDEICEIVLDRRRATKKVLVGAQSPSLEWMSLHLLLLICMTPPSTNDRG